MRIRYPHQHDLPITILTQFILLCALFTGIAAAQKSDNKHIPGLIAQLKHSDFRERAAAAEALGELGKDAKEAAPQLAEALKDADVMVRVNAAEALGRIGPGAKGVVPHLTEALKDDNLGVRVTAAVAIGRIAEGAEEAVVSRMIEALKDPNEHVRSGAADVLGYIGERADRATPQLAEALKDPDEDVRYNAAKALGMIGSGARGALPQLTLALNDPNVRVSRKAAEAVDELSIALAHEKSTEFSDQLNIAAEAMRASADPEVKGHAERVQQASDLLKLLWWEQVKRAIAVHPVIISFVASVLLLLLTWITLLWLRPLWLLHINEALADTTEVSLPEWMGGIKVAPRYIILVGFFHYHSRVLDAWVAKHITSVREMFNRLPTVEERNIYVPLPAVLGGESEADLSPDKMGPALCGKLICLQVWGEGGAGKTSLACRLAQWAMSPEKESRLKAEHLMLPVLVEQDLTISDKDPEHPLLKVIRQQARVMINEEDPPLAGLLRQLLKKRRMLVIIDGFSEMSELSRTAVLTGVADLPINAVIITTRTDEQLGAMPKTEIKPLRVKGNRLSTFMEAYLTARRKRDLFEDDEFFEACRRLSLIVGDRDITALLAKLYAEQMIAAKEGTADADAPENIPELMLSYLSDLSRGAGPGDPDIRVVHRASKIAAWECLKNTLRPTPAPRADVVQALSREGDGESLLKYLEGRLKVVQTVGAGRDRVRFALDPLAEYLAGLHLVDEYGEDEQAWRSFLALVDGRGAAPEEVKGFLLAVRDCCLSNAKNAPGLRAVTDELMKRAGISPEESNRYRIESRVKRLRARLKSPEARDRMHAAEELGSIGAPAKGVVKDLCMLLRDQDDNVRRNAAFALEGIGKLHAEAAPHLVEAVGDTNDAVSLFAIDVVRKLGEEATVAALRLAELLKDPDKRVRKNAAIALSYIGAEETEPHLVEALKDPDWHFRMNVVYALGPIGKKAKERVARYLAEALKDPHEEVRKAAVYALVASGEAAVAYLAQALKGPHIDVRHHVFYALSAIGERGEAAAVLPHLIRALKDADAEVRLGAIEALGRIGKGAKNAVPHLAEALKDPDSRVKLGAAHTLKALKMSR